MGINFEPINSKFVPSFTIYEDLVLFRLGKAVDEEEMAGKNKGKLRRMPPENRR